MTPKMKRQAAEANKSCNDLLKRLEDSLGPSILMDQRVTASQLRKMPKPELMPKSFDEYRGQERVKMLLMDSIHAATKQGKAIDHILLNGLSGQGKSTIAWLVAMEAKRTIVAVTSSTLQKPVDVYNLFKELEHEKFPIVFLDEIHGLAKNVAEMLYIPMETPNTELRSPSTYGSCNLSVTVKPFTMIGATAGEAGKLPGPMLNRFQMKLNMDAYKMEDISDIVKQSCKKIDINMPEELIPEVTRRSSLIPRKANNLLRVISNRIVAQGIKKVDKEVLKTVWAMLELDELGIDRIGRRLLAEIAATQQGSMGVRALASIIGVDERTLTRCHEPDLLALKLIQYLPRGRSITDAGLDYIQKYQKKNKGVV